MFSATLLSNKQVPKCPKGMRKSPRGAFFDVTKFRRSDILAKLYKIVYNVIMKIRRRSEVPTSDLDTAARTSDIAEEYMDGIYDDISARNMANGAIDIAAKRNEHRAARYEQALTKYALTGETPAYFVPKPTPVAERYVPADSRQARVIPFRRHKA